MKKVHIKSINRQDLPETDFFSAEGFPGKIIKIMQKNTFVCAKHLL